MPENEDPEDLGVELDRITDVFRKVYSSHSATFETNGEAASLLHNLEIVYVALRASRADPVVKTAMFRHAELLRKEFTLELERMALSRVWRLLACGRVSDSGEKMMKIQKRLEHSVEIYCNLARSK